MNYQWTEISKHELPGWNERLLLTDAPLYQYPYWNEAFRGMYFKPRYLVYGDKRQPLQYFCILTFGFYGVRIGLIYQAPVRLAAKMQRLLNHINVFMPGRNAMALCFFALPLPMKARLI